MSKILVTGCRGQVGTELMRLGACAGHQMTGHDLDTIDICSTEQVARMLDAVRPSVLINAAAFTAVDRAEEARQEAFAANRDGPAELADACAARKIPLLHISTDFVFDGRKATPYSEDDPMQPVSVYGESKAQGEALVRTACAHHVILRVAWVFGAHGHNFVKTMLRLAREHQTLRVVADQFGGPTPADDIASTLLRIAEQVEIRGQAMPWGTYHYCGKPRTSWHGFTEAIVADASDRGPLRVKRVEAIGTGDYPLPASRPANSMLDCSRIQHVFGIEQPDWHAGLRRMLDALEAAGRD